MPSLKTSRALRALALTFALATLAPPGAAAERVKVNAPWRAGETLVYETESVHREGVGAERTVRRVTDRTEMRAETIGSDGARLTLTTRDSRVEAVEGDRLIADMIAALTDGYDGYGVGVELDRDGRYRRLHDIAAVTAKLRALMTPVFEQNMERLIAPIDPKVSKYDREDALALGRERAAAALEQTLGPGSVEQMMTSQIAPMTAFAGQILAVGRAYRDREPLHSELDGRPLPAQREYTLTIDREDPGLARIRWTHVLDPKGDPEALRALADAYGVEVAPDRGREAPRNLALREEGTLVFRRDTGVVELLEIVTRSRFGDQHDQDRRMRLRLRGSARTWDQEDAARAP